jgi:hypothetical protein
MAGPSGYDSDGRLSTPSLEISEDDENRWLTSTNGVFTYTIRHDISENFVVQHLKVSNDQNRIASKIMSYSTICQFV